MKAFVEGMVAGTALAVSFGPGFVAMMQISLSKGLRGGLTFLSGIVLGDLILIALGYLGFAPILQRVGESQAGLITGAVVLMAFGIYNLLKKGKDIEKNDLQAEAIAEREEVPGTGILLIIKGLVINLSNPLNFIFWIGILILSGRNFGIGTTGFFSFLAGLLVMSAGADVLKCTLSHQLRKKLRQKHLTLVDRVSGFLFLVAGVFLITRL